MSRSIFKYKILEKGKMSIQEIKYYIEEELNRGLAFKIFDNMEEVVKLTGKWQGWAEVEVLAQDQFNIYIDDDFFNLNSIIEQILISLWSNLLDFGEIRLEDFQLTEKINNLVIKSSQSSKNRLIDANGPYFGTIFKPYYGLSLREKIEIAKKFASIGGNFIKEDETYLVDKDRFIEETEKIQKAINSVSNKCYYVPNITPYILDLQFLNKIKDFGIRIGLVSYIITGLANIYKIRRKLNNLLLWGHRVGYKSIKKFISMRVIAKLATYSGFDTLHIGTPFFSIKDTVIERVEILRSIRLINARMLPVFTKVSSKIIPFLLRNFGNEIIIMACGSVRNNGKYDFERMKDIIKEMRNYSRT